MGNREGTYKSAASKLGITLEDWLDRRKSGFQWCYCCREWKEKNEFGIDKSRSNGLSSACNLCRSLKHISHRYSVTVDEARKLKSVQCCAVCGRDKRLEIDHDHVTGTIRGVLCSRCNSIIGWVHEDVEWLNKIIRYLEENDG